MKKSLVILCTILLGFGLVVDAGATLIDFESTAQNNYTSLNFDSGVFTLEAADGSQFAVKDTSLSGAYIDDHVINMSTVHGGTLVKFKGAFSTGSDANYFQIGMGDTGSVDPLEVDTYYLVATDTLGNDVSAFYIEDRDVDPLYGGNFLSVTTANPIDYVLFWSTGSPDNTAYWDNITYETREGGQEDPPKDPPKDPDPNPVPEPATMLLLGAGLVGLVGASRSKFLK